MSGSHAPPAVRRATLADRDAVIRTLVRAFDDDPVSNYLLRKDARRARAFETAFDFGFRGLTLPFRETWMTDDGHGAALWTPPGNWSTSAGLLWAPRLLGAIGVTRVFEVMRAIGRVQAKHPKAPHYYLFSIGVDPDHHGRGLGSALLRATLAKCDAERASAYLESSNAKNEPLYERHGFRVTDRIRIADGGPEISLMWRDKR